MPRAPDDLADPAAGQPHERAAAPARPPRRPRLLRAQGQQGIHPPAAGHLPARARRGAIQLPAGTRMISRGRCGVPPGLIPGGMPSRRPRPRLIQLPGPLGHPARPPYLRAQIPPAAPQPRQGQQLADRDHQLPGRGAHLSGPSGNPRPRTPWPSPPGPRPPPAPRSAPGLQPRRQVTQIRRHRRRQKPARGSRRNSRRRLHGPLIKHPPRRRGTGHARPRPGPAADTPQPGSIRAGGTTPIGRRNHAEARQPPVPPAQRPVTAPGPVPAIPRCSRITASRRRRRRRRRCGRAAVPALWPGHRRAGDAAHRRPPGLDSIPGPAPPGRHGQLLPPARTRRSTRHDATIGSGAHST